MPKAPQQSFPGCICSGDTLGSTVVVRVLSTVGIFYRNNNYIYLFYDHITVVLIPKCTFYSIMSNISTIYPFDLTVCN